MLLLVRVSVTTLGQDRNVKLPFYAHFGIPETWVSDTIAALSRLMRGTYRDIMLVGRGEILSLKTVPGFRIGADAVPP